MKSEKSYKLSKKKIIIFEINQIIHNNIGKSRNSRRTLLDRVIVFGIAIFLWICAFDYYAAISVAAQDFRFTKKSKASGNLIMAVSGTPGDIQAAVDSASIGYTVIIPEGYFLFDRSVTVPGGITLQGRGEDKTILKKSVTSKMFIFDGSNGERFQFSGIKLIGLEGALDWDTGLHLMNDCKDFRIFNCEFRGFGHAGIVVLGNARGVIDHNNFIDCYYPGLGYGVVIYGDGDAGWSQPLELGTENALFVEGNTFSGCRHSIASNNGSRYVFRYNTVYTNRYGHQIDVHGKSSWPRGSRTYEIYENTFIGEDTRGQYDHNTSIGIRGGNGVIFNNTITESTNRPIHLANDSGDDGPYPEDDQIRELHMWNNYSNGTEITQAGCAESMSVAYIQARFLDEPIILQEGRDYYFSEKSGYTPYAYPHPLTLNNPILSISMISLEFNATIDGYNPPSQAFQILNSGSGILDWTITDDASWLDCSPLSGLGDNEIIVAVDKSGLSVGTYTTTITVSSPNASNSPQQIPVTLTVTNSELPLSASASASSTSGVVPLTIDFTANANGGTFPYSYSWNFGDGNTSSSQNPSHTYSQPGNYTASLTVTDSNGSQASDSLTITVNASTVNLSISTVTVSSNSGSGGTTDPLPGNHSYSIESSVHVAAVPNANYRFSKWSGDISTSDIYNKQTTITMDKNKSISANFFTKCGDVTGDLSITPADAQAAFDIFLGKNSNPTENEKENADVNCDGTETQPLITPADAQAIFDNYVGKNGLPCDCSCISRSPTLSIMSEQPQNINIIINAIQAAMSEEILVLIVIASPFNIKAFGFDLIFASDMLEYVGVGRNESLNEFYNIDANKIAEGVIRAGGYRIESTMNRYPQILIKLIFRKTGEEKKQPALLIVNTVDDIKNAHFKNEIVTKKIVDVSHNKSR